MFCVGPLFYTHPSAHVQVLKPKLIPKLGPKKECGFSAWFGSDPLLMNHHHHHHHHHDSSNLQVALRSASWNTGNSERRNPNHNCHNFLGRNYRCSFTPFHSWDLWMLWMFILQNMVKSGSPPADGMQSLTNWVILRHIPRFFSSTINHWSEGSDQQNGKEVRFCIGVEMTWSKRIKPGTMVSWNNK